MDYAATLPTSVTDETTASPRPGPAPAKGPHILETLSKKADWLLLPMLGVIVCLVLWALVAGRETRVVSIDDFGDKITKVQRVGLSPDLPSPIETWQKSKL